MISEVSITCKRPSLNSLHWCIADVILAPQVSQQVSNLRSTWSNIGVLLRAQMHNSLKLRIKDSLAYINKNCYHVNRSFRFFWIINTKATNIEVRLKYFFSVKYIVHLFKTHCTLIRSRLQNLSIISFTTESKGVGFSSRFDVTIYFETTWSDANQFMTSTQVVTNALPDSGGKQMMLNSFKSTFRKKGEKFRGFRPGARVHSKYF